MKLLICAYSAALLLFSALLSGCGNLDGTVTLNRSDTSELVKVLGTYEGEAHPKRVMGAMMTGKWTVRFVQDDTGNLKCKCTLRLHDELHGWGSPTTETVDVRIWRGSGKNVYSLQADGQETRWMLPVKDVSINPGQTVSTVTFFDMDSYEISLNRI